MPIGTGFASWSRANGVNNLRSPLANCQSRGNFAPMKTVLFALFVATLVSGCSIHSKQQLASVRAAGVPDETLLHLRENTPLTPTDLIDMKKRGVDDSIAILHMERVGVDYEAHKDDVARLRAAGVSDRVRDAFMRATDRYSYWRYNAPQVVYVDSDPWWGWGPIGFGVGYTYVSHHHRHCR